MSHDVGGGDQSTHMQVMSAHVPHRHIVSRVVLRVDLAGIRKSGFFLHGKRIQLSAQHDRTPRSVAEDCDDAGAADMLRNIVSERAQLRSQFRRRLDLMARKLRVLMQLEIESVR